MKKCHLEFCKGDGKGFCEVCKHVSRNEYTITKVFPDYFRQGNLPVRYHSGMKNYLNRGTQPGGFLLACLKNNLKETYFRADYDSTKLIPQIVNWLYEFAPSESWGSPEKVTKWINFIRREYQEIVKSSNCPECIESAEALIQSCKHLHMI